MDNIVSFLLFSFPGKKCKLLYLETILVVAQLLLFPFLSRGFSVPERSFCLRTDSLDKTLSLADQKNGDFYIPIKKELFIFAQVFN